MNKSCPKICLNNTCRFLEETNCVGMCTNLCKMPSQVFIKDSFGMPVNMVPSIVPKQTLQLVFERYIKYTLSSF